MTIPREPGYSELPTPIQTYIAPQPKPRRVQVWKCKSYHNPGRKPNKGEKDYIGTFDSWCNMDGDSLAIIITDAGWCKWVEGQNIQFLDPDPDQGGE